MFWTFWAHLDHFGPFQTRNDILFRNNSAKPYFVHLGQKYHFCLKWFKRVQMGPKGFQMVKNILANHFGFFWTPLDQFGMFTSLPCLAIFVCFIGAFILGQPVVHHILTFVLPMFFLFLEQLSIILVAQEFRSIMKQVWDQGRWY